MCRTAALGAAVILLFTSRACYNLTVLFLSQSHRVESFNYDWYNVSDQVTVVVSGVKPTVNSDCTIVLHQLQSVY